MNGNYITAGVKNRNDDSGQTIEIANGVWNNDMPYQGNNNDFIILKLKSALTFNENVGPACLPEPGYAPETTGQTCFVSGWGTLKSGANNLPKALQWVAVPTVTNAKCSEAYNGITSSMICAGSPDGGVDSCQGDSGGPFVCRKDGKAILTGVVSFGVGCGLASHPGVYARMTAVLDWVKANMEGGSGSPPPGPPSPTTAAPPTSGCGSPQWVGDDYCDDDNNNAECEYDGGDCCDNNMDGWDTYCSECECKEPNPAPQPCTDEWPLSQCEKRKERGKCSKINVARKCKETCGFCGCVDIWPVEKCEKKKGKCGKAKIAELCKETCDLC